MSIKKPTAKSKASKARDEALEKVTQNNSDFVTEALDFIEMKVPYGWIGTGEDIRFLLDKAGFKRPKHHNSYGALVMIAVRYRKMLKKTGKYRPMKSASSHARSTAEYKKVI